MNDTEVFEQRGIIDGPGAILRRAREAKGLDVAAVAAMLHLTEYRIQAIEADDFDSLPEPVFVRGYLKNYARLLDEPAGPVLDAYSKFSYEVELNEHQFVDSEVKVEVNGDHDFVKIVSILLVVAVIAVPLVWWWDDLGQAVQNLTSTKETTQPELAIPIPISQEGEAASSESTQATSPDGADSGMTGEPPVVEEGGDRISTSIQLTPAREPVESVIKEIEPSATESGQISISLPQQPELTADIKPLAEPEPEQVKTVIEVPVPAPKPAPVPAPVDTGVWFNFVDSGWVKVRDAKDRVILIGDHKKGIRKRLTSVMPYKVVLGNSNAVQVEIDGKVADISKYSSGGVARFTIVDGKIEKP